MLCWLVHLEQLLSKCIIPLSVYLSIVDSCIILSNLVICTILISTYMYPVVLFIYTYVHICRIITHASLRASSSLRKSPKRYENPNLPSLRSGDAHPANFSNNCASRLQTLRLYKKYKIILAMNSLNL